MTGTQALVRILLDQARRDRAAGLNTAGFVSGYRGSPLGGVDLELWRAAERIKNAGIEFLPAVNEDLAATAVLGSQQVETNPARQYDGVFGMWYGKGPGVDRAGDALKHGNAYGSSQHGGRSRRCGRRSWLRLIVDATPVRCRLHGLVHADAQSGQRFGVSGFWRIWLRAVAIFRHVGRLQGGVRDGRICRFN